MRTEEVFDLALKHSGVTQKELSAISGFPEQSIGQKINIRKTVKAKEFLYLLKCLGIYIEIYDKDDNDLVVSNKDDDLSVGTIFEAMLQKESKSFKEAAALLGYTPQNLNVKVNVRESIRMKEFFDIIEFFNMEAIFRIQKTGEILMKNSKKHERIIGMADRIVFDTDKSSIVSSSLYANGKSKYGDDGKALELYVDQENRYFFVEYKEDDKPKIRVAALHLANAFIDKYGKVEKEVGVPA